MAASSDRCDSANQSEQDELHHREMLISAGVCEALASAMTHGGEHREVAYYSAAAVSVLAEGGDTSACEAKTRLMNPPVRCTESDRDGRTTIKTDPTIVGDYPGICRLLQRHNDSPEVAEVCCNAITNLATFSPVNCARFIAVDAPGLVVAVLDKHSPDHAAAAVQGCRALWVSRSSSTSYQHTLSIHSNNRLHSTNKFYQHIYQNTSSAYGLFPPLPPHILSTLPLPPQISPPHPFHPPPQALVSFHPECNAFVGTAQGGCAAVVRCLIHHPYSAENATHVFNAVWAFAEDPENNLTFLRGQTQTQTEGQGQGQLRIIGQGQEQGQGQTGTEGLGQKEGNDQGSGSGLVEEVVKALARFHEQEDCAEQGCAAIWGLARNLETRALLGTFLGAGMAVARCINSHPDHPDCW